MKLICGAQEVPAGQKATLTHNGDGIISITYMGLAKGVCDEQFNAKSAAVACQELYGSPEVVSFSGDQECVYGSDFWLSSVHCLGTEASIQDCPHAA